MKRFTAIVLTLLTVTAVMTQSLAFTAAADYQKRVRAGFKHIVAVSYDEVRYSLKPNGHNEASAVICGSDAAKIDTPHLPEKSQAAIFWGWISAKDSDIESFEFLHQGVNRLCLDIFKVDPEPAVVRSAPGEYTYRFKVIVPIAPEGISRIQLYANFADGTKEEFWSAKVYVPPYDEASFADPEVREVTLGDVNDDGAVNNKDVVTLFRYINGVVKSINTAAADMNKDNAINNKDVITLFRYVSNPEYLADWQTVNMYDATTESKKTPAALSAGSYLSQHFSINSRFKKLSLSCPSWSNDIGDMTVSLYKFTKSSQTSMTNAPIVRKVFHNYKDNSWLDLTFDPQPAGDYVIVLSDAVETVGVWVYPSATTGSVLLDGGVSMTGEFAMRVTADSPKTPLFNTAKEESTGGVVPPEPEDSPAIISRDAMPDTWVATDGLGRVLPTNAEVGDPKKDKYVGMFYWTWHVEHAKAYSPVNLQSICDRYPDAVTNHNHSVWSTIGAYYGCFWNEPLFGYYTTVDKWVLRRHAEMLADAGVDVVIFDNTNGTFTWKQSYMTLLQTFKEAREDGVKTPKVSFILPFGDYNAAAVQLREIYQSAYKNSGYNELWFYWEGKPLMMSLTSGLNRSNALDAEIYSFFTWRAGVPEYNATSKTNSTRWGWLAKYPQAIYTDPQGMKQTTVGVAQNWNGALTAMNGNNVFGRTYTSKGYDTRENAKLYGANFAEQWEYAIKNDVNFVFVTGWNEWVAQKQPTWQGVTNAFPDQFNDTYSRDIEPSKGDLKDHYYYQLISYVRKFKGVRAIPTPTAEKTIDINGSVSQWDSVGPYYVAYKGNTFDRDSDGYKTMHYTNKTGRNDIVGAKVSRDGQNLYFMVECAQNITSYTGKAWMRLFIDTGSSANNWEGFEYVLNRVSPTATAATLERSKGGWSWTTVGTVSYKVNGKYLTVKIPKSYLGITGSSFTINFKWNDNMQNDGDILDFYSNGDTAPGGRFMYSYVVK